jgi:hypothetical protein
MHGYRALRTGHQLIPCKQTIAFYQNAPAAIRRDRYHLPDYLTDDTD